VAYPTNSAGAGASLNPDELIKDIVVLLQQNFGYYHVQIYLIDPERDVLVLKQASGKIGKQLLEDGYVLPMGTGIIGQVMETATPFVTNNVDDVIFFYRNPLLPDTQSELTVPIRVSGHVVGVLDIQDKPPHHLTDGVVLMTAVPGNSRGARQGEPLYKLQTAPGTGTDDPFIDPSERLALRRLLARCLG
jgi:putative methionine-R-sulfoxide reductase with GAF domain